MVMDRDQEKVFIRKLIDSQLGLWSQLTQSQKKIIMREFEAKEMYKRISRDPSHRFSWKPEIDFQVVSELMTYCDAKEFRMNDQRWILLPRFELEKQRVKTSNSLLSDLKQVTNGRTRAIWEPDSVDVIDAVAGFRITSLVRQYLDKGRVEWDTDRNPKWEWLSPVDDSDSGSD
jgi:hypothetical protein